MTYLSTRRRRELLVLAFPFHAVARQLRRDGQPTGEIERRLRALIDDLPDKPRTLAASAGLWDRAIENVVGRDRGTAACFFAAVHLSQHLAGHGFTLPDALIDPVEEITAMLSDGSMVAHAYMARSSRQRAQEWLALYQDQGLFPGVPPVPQMSKAERDAMIAEARAEYGEAAE